MSEAQMKRAIASAFEVSADKCRWAVDKHLVFTNKLHLTELLS